MDNGYGITPRDLEHMLCDESVEPKALPLSLLEQITNGFSDEQKIGRGGFAVVYKGMLENKTVAVKRMSNAFMDEKMFHREVQCLMTAKHKNIIRFLGYCADRQGVVGKYEGKFVMADVHERLLCFEYLPKGSLLEYITDTSYKLRWREWYNIITGICHGLHYLHQQKIAHLDLKPANILLDDNLVAKIADFGLSRCFIGETESQLMSKIGGTFGYLAPECCKRDTQVKYGHAYRLDIYSLGVVIMEILTKGKEYHIVDNVVEIWSNIVEISQRDEQLEQVRVCATIVIECTNFNPAQRPDTQQIIWRLDETKSMDSYFEIGVSTSCQSRSKMAFQYLKEIRNNFSDEKILGKDGFGVVYKGVLDNGEVAAVKKISAKLEENREDALESRAGSLPMAIIPAREQKQQAAASPSVGVGEDGGLYFH